MIWEIEFRRGEPYDVAIATYGAASREGFVGFNSELVRDRRWRCGMSVLLDHTELDMSPLTGEDVEAIAQFLIGLEDRLGPVVCAIVDPDPYGAGIEEVSVGFISAAGYHIRTFPARRSAVGWLNALKRHGSR